MNEFGSWYMFVVGGEQDDPDRDRYTNVSNAVVCG